ncbi:MAG: putative zinc-binding protein, partial [Fibrobacterota bacterium]|nr:putative zinc-binding protein [Chitinispirillaceae bacterium]
MKTESQCGCNAVPAERYIALACSGASDLGELADRVCRKLRSEMPDTSMNCLAKLGFGEQSLRD